jgi:ABC-type multidrug transport system ATPase subunit
MSSQHLEEADELADRICIMTKGQLLALDTPDRIKQQFGVGYKLLIEPKPDQISLEEFAELKANLIDGIMKSFSQYKITENHESTSKRLIYQIPFTNVNGMNEILHALESQLLAKTYIDVEVNSLEDAYINIAKEEEKLLKQLERGGV